MTTDPRSMKNGKYGTALSIRVIPGAKRNEFAGINDDGTIKIRLTAPPVDGKANSALIDFLSKILDVPRSAIDIVAGENRRDKLISVVGIDPEIVERRILQFRH